MKMSNHQQLLLMIAPVVLFTVVEEWGGLRWALILSVVYAILEMGWEFFRYRRISGMTFFSNAMVVGLSMVSYYTEDGFWFKMQPAILEIVMAGLLLGSFFLKRPMLVVMMQEQHLRQQQNQYEQQVLQSQIPSSPSESPKSLLAPSVEALMKGMTLRLGIFFIFQAGLAVYAALYWSTEVWAFLKSIGIFIMMMFYLGGEILIFRRSLKK